ncbi:antitoxin PaaA2 family protein [Pseudomonas sp.]|uniref:antitoxin PaaA2 family protein n=1 Tax=Pseudomonas sp. TaxID=306 RepID=UPI003F97AC50
MTIQTMLEQANGDVITLRPVRPSWQSLAELPAADSDFLQERPDIISDEGRLNEVLHAHYDKWFKAQAQESIDDPRPSISDEDAQQLFSAKRESLRNRARR